jgi:tight adherence protein B
MQGRRTLRRRPTVFDQAPARSVSGKIDQAFDHLVLESGWDCSPVTGFLMLIASGLLVGGVLWSYNNDLLSGIAGMALGMTLPLVVMMVQRSRRLHAVREQLPYVLDLLARAVRAGESLDNAIALVGRETKGVLGKEFLQCARQLQMGSSVESIVKSLASRIRLVELRILATTLTVHRQAGGNLAEALERMAGVVRDRLSARRQMRASTGAGRASAILIATVSPLAYLVMFLWQPEHVRVLYDDPLGLTLLAVAVTLEVIGVLWVVALLQNEN